MEDVNAREGRGASDPPFESDGVAALASGVERWIKERPMTALVAAVITGYVVARVLRDE
ncbi:MAG: hypothetical protein R3F35_23735 [Myxococcota bacterium]